MDAKTYYELYAHDGLTFQQIADKFEGVTRNAVIGKVNRYIKRNGLSAQPTPRVSRCVKAPVKQPSFLAHRPSAPRIPAPDAPKSFPEVIARNCCRWIDGDPRKGTDTYGYILRRAQIDRVQLLPGASGAIPPEAAAVRHLMTAA